MAKIIGVVGTRRRNTDNDFKIVSEKFFEIYKEGDIICSGGCPKGADNFAQIIHEQHKIPILIFPANWEKYGKRAGAIRNKDIAKFSHELIACVSHDRTGGVEITIKFFEQSHKETKSILV